MTNLVNRTAIYARFSSDKQSERSIDDQVALCRTYCERNELSVVGVYDDRAISGASTVNRLGWEKLMRDARGGKFDVVVAEALDRISRDQEDLAGIYKRLRFVGIEIRTVQDGKAEEIHIGVKGLVGALYLKDFARRPNADRPASSATVATTAAAPTAIARSRDKTANSKSWKTKLWWSGASSRPTLAESPRGILPLA
jgi:predicted site-specific integrase-resolvase